MSWYRQGYDLKEERPQKLAALRPLAYDDIGMYGPRRAWPLGLASSSTLDNALKLQLQALMLGIVTLHNVCIASEAACKRFSCRVSWPGSDVDLLQHTQKQISHIDQSEPHIPWLNLGGTASKLSVNGFVD